MKPINKYIDHTLLKPTATNNAYLKLFDEAIEHQFFSVCIPPSFSELAVKKLFHTDVKVCSVVGFPSGLNTSKIKEIECSQLLSFGVDEIDMVANLSIIKSHNWVELYSEVKAIKRTCNNNILKVIVESSLLTKFEILQCCLVFTEAGVDFIKTSTGFNGPGANLDDVIYMNTINTNTNLKIKASGGIRNPSTALKFISSGCLRIGTSSGVNIMNQLITGSKNESSSRSNY